MTQVDLGSRVGVGVIGKEAFVTVIPPLSDEEIEVMMWAGAIGSADEVRRVDESAGIVGLEEPGDTLEESVHRATQKAGQIAHVFSAYQLREEVTIFSLRSVDLTDHAS
jgi:hypothetical protein